MTNLSSLGTGLGNVLSGKNGTAIMAITGICFVYFVDAITKSEYKIEARGVTFFFSVEPTGVKNKEACEETNEETVE